MKRNIRAIWLACLVIFCMVVSVCVIRDTASASSVKNKNKTPFEAFILGDKLYVFFEDGKDATVTMVLNEEIDKTSKETFRLKESRQYVHYFILIDASGSVKEPEREQIKEFVMKLIKDTKVRALVTVMTLGEASATVIEEATEDDAVEKALKDISYNDQTTNLYKGINSAIDYIDKKGRSGRGDLYRLILLTDGKPDGVTKEPTPEDVKTRVEARTDIVFDVIGVGDWNKKTEKQLPMSGRKVTVVRNKKEALEAAQKLASETNKLYSVSFELSQPVSERGLNIKLMLKKDGSNSEILDLQNITVIGKEQISAEAEQTEPPKKEDESQDPDGVIREDDKTPESDGTQEDDGTSEGDEKPKDDGTPDDDGKPEDDGTEDGETSNDDEAQPAPTQDPGQSLDEETFSQKVMKNVHDYGVFLLGGLVLCAAVIIILRKNPRKKGKMAHNHLRIEVVSGKYASKKGDFSLEHTLIIGSGRECDIIWNEFDVSGQNTRIFIHEGTIFIEDLNSSCGTVINGMRIFAPNRLRSGDIVSIGSRVQFRIFFNMQ